MIGTVTMEIDDLEMNAAIQFYLNNSVFNAESDYRKYHRARVTRIFQRTNGRFVIEFEGGAALKVVATPLETPLIEKEAKEKR